MMTSTQGFIGPPMQVLHMMDGPILHQSLAAAARLGIADLLDCGERTTSDLATVACVNEDALYRLLRFLTGHGVFRETGLRSFANTSLSECLRKDISGSVHSILLSRGTARVWSSLGALLYSIQTGRPAQEAVMGMNTFEYLQQHPSEACLFDDAMTAISALWVASITNAYDFGRWGRIMDVGGGTGFLLAAILEAHPDLHGVLAERAAVLEHASARGFPPRRLAGRLECQAVDFFHEIPSGCRAYLMKNIIHDWDDERARRILINCRRAVPENGLLLLLEHSVGEENAPSLGKTVDILMLTLTGGRERSVAEHADLLRSANFRLNRVIPVCAELMILEASPE